jgi:hypothetical protein
MRDCGDKANCLAGRQYDAIRMFMKKKTNEAQKEEKCDTRPHFSSKSR